MEINPTLGHGFKVSKGRGRERQREKPHACAALPVRSACPLNPRLSSQPLRLPYQVMSVSEWAARWKCNDDFPECLNCGGGNTKEHHFMQAREGAKPTQAPSQPFLSSHVFCVPSPILSSLVLSPFSIQTWCRGKKTWEAESLCMDCLAFSWRVEIKKKGGGRPWSARGPPSTLFLFDLSTLSPPFYQFLLFSVQAFLLRPGLQDARAV